MDMPLKLDGEAEDLYPAEEEDRKKLVAWVMASFTDAKTGRQELEDRWLSWYKMYRSWAGVRPKGDWRARNWIPLSFYVIETIVPRLVAQLPKLTVAPVGPEDTEGAKELENLLEWATDQSDLYLELVKAFKSALTYGTGILKTFYDEKTAWSIRREQVMQDVMAEVPTGEMDMDGAPMTQQVSMGQIPTGETKMVREPVTKYAGPVAEAVDVFDFFPSPEATCMEDAQFVIHRVFRTREQIEKMAERGVYKLPADEDWRRFVTSYDFTPAQRLSAINLGPGGSTTAIEANKLIEVLECWTDDAVVAVAGGSVLLRAERNPFAHGEKPFVRIVDHLVPHEFHGIGELEPLEGIQDAMNALWNSRLDNVKLVLNTMFAVSVDYLVDPSDLKVRPGGTIRVREGVPIDQVIKPIDLGEVTNSSYTEAAEIERMSEKVSGVSAYQMGTDSSALNRTATGVALISEQGNTRFAHKVRISELTGLRRLARHFGSILQQYMPDQMVMRIAGEQGQYLWQTLTPESIEGAFDYNVEAESASQTESIRREQTLSLFQMLAADPYMKPLKIREDVLTTFGRKDIGSYLYSEQELQMMAQQQQQAALPPGSGQPSPDQNPDQMAQMQQMGNGQQTGMGGQG